MTAPDGNHIDLIAKRRAFLARNPEYRKAVEHVLERLRSKEIVEWDESVQGRLDGMLSGAAVAWARDASMYSAMQGRMDDLRATAVGVGRTVEQAEESVGRVRAQMLTGVIMERAIVYEENRLLDRELWREPLDRLASVVRPDRKAYLGAEEMLGGWEYEKKHQENVAMVRRLMPDLDPERQSATSWRRLLERAARDEAEAEDVLSGCERAVEQFAEAVNRIGSQLHLLRGRRAGRTSMQGAAESLAQAECSARAEAILERRGLRGLGFELASRARLDLLTPSETEDSL